MTTPIELPIKASEVSAVADLVFQQAAGGLLNEDARARLASRFAGLELTSFEAFPGSLASDPVQPGTYYLAVDALEASRTIPLLLHISSVSAPSGALFPKAKLIGRMRPSGEREVVVSAIPFGPADREHVRTFVEQVEPAFLPRPQGPQPAIAAGNRHPEISLPAAFDAFRTIHKSTGVNLASTVQLSATREMTTDDTIASRDGENPCAIGHTRVSIQHLYHAGLWAATRAGWRNGYTAEADHVIVVDSPGSMDAARRAIEDAAGFTKFTTDASHMFELRADKRHPQAWSDAEVLAKYEADFTAEDRAWIESEFSRAFAAGDKVYRFTRLDLARLAVKFGRSLRANEELYDFIARTKAASTGGRAFDFEPSIDEAETLTTASELIFYLQWLKARGRPAQLVPPNLGFKKRQAYPEEFSALETYVGHKMWPELLPRVAEEFGSRPLNELAARVGELAGVARHFNATLSVHSGSGKQASVLEQIGRATSGRVNYKISGELQLQLFDVLSEQAPGSEWRMLYERMVERCEGFAAGGAFGEESGLAAKYRQMRRGLSLGNSARGRVDGNLFLVFWLGNMVGSRDSDGVFFKDKLDRLPRELVKEVRRRNSEYIVWLAQHLRP